MLHDLHEGHKRLEKMQHLAHDRIYWQGMDADITEYVKNCKICTRHKAMQAIQPMIPRDIPKGPWQDLAADVFHHNNADYLLIADTFSKYPFLYSHFKGSRTSNTQAPVTNFTIWTPKKSLNRQWPSIFFRYLPSSCNNSILSTLHHHLFTPNPMGL